MKTLIEFLEARLAEDEAAARATLIDVDGSGDWRADERPVALTVDLYRVRDINARPVVEGIRSLDDEDDPDNITEYVNGAAVAQHVARHDPARVLREVAAKRAVIRQYEDVREQARHPVSAENRMRARVAEGELLEVLQHIAVIYSNHTDHDPNWSTT